MNTLKMSKEGLKFNLAKAQYILSEVELTDKCWVTLNEGDIVKVVKPDMFHEEQLKLKDWLMQLQLYFKFQGNTVSEDQKVLFIITYMWGMTQKWVKLFLQKYMKDKTDKDIQWFKKFKDFKKEITWILVPFNEKQITTRIIQHFTQKWSCAEYAT